MTSTSATATTAVEQITLSYSDDGAALTFTAGGRQIATYTYKPTDAQYESPRPYFHPLTTLGGDEVTIFRPWDHVWHKGLSLALPNVGKDNFWGGRHLYPGNRLRQPGQQRRHDPRSLHRD